MGNKASLMLQDTEVQQISEETGFSQSQIEKLYTRYAHLDRNNCGTLSKDDLLSIPELAINPLCDRLIEMFFAGQHPEYPSQRDDLEERINFKQFVRVLSAFKPSSTATATTTANRSYNQETSQEHSNDTTKTFPRDDSMKRKLSFVFRIYDVDNDGRISFNDLRNILKMMVGNHIDEVQLNKIATRAFVEVDQDSDGFINFSEFCKVFAGKDLDDKLRVKFFH